MPLVDQMNDRLRIELTLAGAVGRILDDSMALTGAEFGTFQLPGQRNNLLLVAHRGFHQPFLDTFRIVEPNHGSACGRALRSGKTVLIEDIERDREFTPFRAIARMAGYRCVLTTPLKLWDETIMGVVATHFANIHHPTGIEIETLEGYAGEAADHLSSLVPRMELGSVAERLNNELFAALALSSIGAPTPAPGRPNIVGGN